MPVYKNLVARRLKSIVSFTKKDSRTTATVVLSISSDVPAWKASSEWQPLVQLTQEQHQEIVQKFCQWVDELSVLNGPRQRAWWYTWLASRDQLNCKILNWWRELHCLEQLLQQRKHDKFLEINLSHPILIPTVQVLAHQHGYRVKRNPTNTLKCYLDRFKNLFAYLYQWLKFIYYALVSNCFCRSIHGSSKNTSPFDILLVSIFHGKEFSGSEYCDTYFGKFNSYLSKRGLNVATVGFCYNQPKRILSSILGSGFPDVHPFGSNVSLLEIAKISSLILLFPFCLKRHHPRYPVFCYWDNIADAWMYGLAMLGEATLRQLCDQQESSPKILQMFENNPWERCVAFAAQKSNRNVYRFGFHHCAVVPFHLKTRLSSMEIGERLVPDELISTGANASQVLRALIQLEIPIKSGCHLRAKGHLEPVKEIEKIVKDKSPLVVLEALWKATDLLAIVLLYLRRFPNEVIYVRAHPVLSLDVILDVMQEKRENYPNLQERTCTLEEDLSKASLVIYQGSTVAMTAAASKIPLLHFSGNLYPTDNPLFLVLPAVKELYDADGLQKALDLLKSGKLYSNLDIDAISDYANSYLRLPDKVNLDKMYGLII
jgi:hypothetical protein